MFLIVFLILTFFLTAGVVGLCVALNVKNCAVRLEAWHLSNLQLRAHAKGDLGPPDRLITANGFRGVGGLMALLGLGMILAPLISALIG